MVEVSVIRVLRIKGSVPRVLQVSEGSAPRVLGVVGGLVPRLLTWSEVQLLRLLENSTTFLEHFFLDRNSNT